MPDLVTAATTDSVNDGAGPDTSPVPPQLSNNADDFLLMQVTVSLNGGAPPTVATPAGWDVQQDERDNELRMYVFSRRSTGGETFPTLTSSAASEWSCSSVVVEDVDYTNGPVGASASVTGGGDIDSPDLTSSTLSAASAFVFFYSLERRVVSGFAAAGTRVQTKLLTSTFTGTSEGTDNACAVATDFTTARGVTMDGPSWDASGGGDSIAFNVEVLTLGNIVPVQVSFSPTESFPDQAIELTDDWCQIIVDSGVEANGTALPAALSFDAALANTGTNEITIVGHGITESVIYRVEANGNTLPTGLTDSGLYFARPTSADTLQLAPVNTDLDAIGDWYVDETTLLGVATISAVGSGSCLLREARIANTPNGGFGSFTRPNRGDTANVGAFSNGWIGDSGYHQNWCGVVARLTSVFDATGRTIQFSWTLVNALGQRINSLYYLAIDEDGDWIVWKVMDVAVDSFDAQDKLFQIQPAETSVIGNAHYEHGTFDATRIRYHGLVRRGSNNTDNRPEDQTASEPILANEMTVIGGSATITATWSEVVSVLGEFVSTVSQPSDIQFTFLASISLGDGTTDLYFSDSEKSIAFPPPADGVSSFDNYVNVLGLTVNASGSSGVSIVNSQIGASLPFDLVINKDAGATVTLDGNSYVFGNVQLDSDQVLSRQLFVGGNGLSDNGAEITGSTFIVNNQVGADNGMVSFGAGTDISSSTFSASENLTAGHALIITTPGTYSLEALTFEGFGVDESQTAAVYNNSGGAVTLNVSGGSTPTVRNGAGASTTVLAGAQVTLTGLQPASEVRAFLGTDPDTATELAGVESSGTTFGFSQSEAGSDGYIVVLSLQYENIVLPITYQSQDVVIPIQQRFDRQYENPS